MIVSSIAVGDVFMGTTGNRMTILEIECGFDEDEDRWETSIRYELFVAATNLSLPITEKARAVVQNLSSGDFCSQLHASGNVTTSDTAVSNGNNISVLANNFLINAAKYGMSPSDLDKTVKLMYPGGTCSTKYQIVGAAPNKRLRPIVVEGPGGGLKYITVDQAKEGIELYKRRKVRKVK